MGGYISHTDYVVLHDSGLSEREVRWGFGNKDFTPVDLIRTHVYIWYFFPYFTDGKIGLWPLLCVLSYGLLYSPISWYGW